MDIESFIVCIEADDIYSHTEEDLEIKKEKDRKVIGLIKEDIDGKVMKEFAILRAKGCSYLTDNNEEAKKAKRPKHVSQKEQLNLKVMNIVSKQLNSKTK